MDTTLYELIAKGGIGALCVYLLSIAFPKIVESITTARGSIAESGARVDTIEMQQAQINRLNQAFQDIDAKLRTAREEFEAERNRRIAAESTIALLTSRVGQLEKQIKDLGHTPV